MTDRSTGDRGAPVRAADRLIAIVESFVAHPTQTLSEISAACGLDPASVTRYLKQLVDSGWLVRDDVTRAYRLGIRLFMIGQLARDQDAIRRRALPKMRELLERFDETVNMGVHRGDEVVIIESLESKRSIRRGASIGEIDGWFDSSLGKCILAHLPEDQVLALAETNMPVRHTAKTLDTVEKILAELAVVRAQGYAVDDEEAEVGLKCVGVPLVDPDGGVTHAISISGPTHRMNEQFDDIVATMQALSRQLSGRIEVETR